MFLTEDQKKELNDICTKYLITERIDGDTAKRIINSLWVFGEVHKYSYSVHGIEEILSKNPKFFVSFYHGGETERFEFSLRKEKIKLILE